MPDQHPNHDATRIAEAFDRCTQAAQQGEVAYLRLHTGTTPSAEPADILDRINNTLAYMTDAQTGPGDTEWPYSGQF